MEGRRLRPPTSAMLMILGSAMLVPGCSDPKPITIEGHAVSMRFDPNRVAGLAATDGPSGPRVALPSSVGRVRNTDDSSTDRLALLAAEDIAEFWNANYQAPLAGVFSPVSGLVSVDPNASGPSVCGGPPGELEFNAAYCHRSDVIAWDRVELLPVAEKFFGDMAVNGLLAHEYGHAVQDKAGLTDDGTPLIVSEQQADCFAGTYMRWVAQGGSPRFVMNTTTALDRVLAGAIAIRDRPPSFNPFGLMPVDASHGTALDRVSAFQEGFDLGVRACAHIDSAEIGKRRGNIPAALFDPAGSQSDMPIDERTLSSLITVLNDIFKPEHGPPLRLGVSCGSGPATFCPNSDAIEVNLMSLQQLGTPADENQRVLLQGDNSAISVVTSRYMLAIQKEQGLSLEGETAAMRTACLTGVAQNLMSDAANSNNQLVLGAGDLDEAVSGLLTNGLAASDTRGQGIPSGFTRILAFRSGLSDGDPRSCYRRFP